MENKISTIEYTRFHSLDELEPDEIRLIQEAISILQNSYSPYSHFKVGAAVSLSDGTIIKGTNQENAAFPSGLCAERVALFNAHSSFPDKAIRKIAIAAHDLDSCFHAVYPCGSCLQVMSEYEYLADVPLQIFLFHNEKEIYAFNGIKNLMPFSFQFK